MLQSYRCSMVTWCGPDLLLWFLCALQVYLKITPNRLILMSNTRASTAGRKYFPGLAIILMQ